MLFKQCLHGDYTAPVMIVRDHLLRCGHSSEHTCGLPDASRIFLCEHAQIKRPFLVAQQIDSLLHQIWTSFDFRD
ncbi:hypothetical protein D3C71_1770670 [compost metagenome]